MNASQQGRAALPTPIRIAAPVISDQDGRILLVRKRGTLYFMQPGGNMQDGETAPEALVRELEEELGCTVVDAQFLGVYSARAANEPMRVVQATLFWTTISGEIRAGAEIEEVTWIEPCKRGNLQLAPLTRDHVFPLVLRRR